MVLHSQLKSHPVTRLRFHAPKTIKNAPMDHNIIVPIKKLFRLRRPRNEKVPSNNGFDIRGPRNFKRLPDISYILLPNNKLIAAHIGIIRSVYMSYSIVKIFNY